MKSADITENKNLSTEAAVAAALALDFRNPDQVRFHNDEDIAFTPTLLIAPTGVQVKSMERFSPTPEHAVDVHIALHTARDLHAYVIAQTGLPGTSTSTSGTAEPEPEPEALRPAIFANRDTMSIKAFLDYHGITKAKWLNHTACVDFKESHQFKRWKNVNNKPMTQESFALFLDEVINDFESPTGAEVLSFAENLEATSTQVFKSAVKLTSGQMNYTFTDSRDGDVSTAIIEKFTIGIPVWQGGEKVAIEARLFHRIVDNKDASNNPTGTKSLRFWFTLRHLDEIIDALFGKEVEFLRTAFNGIAPIYSGIAPDAPKPLPLGLGII